MQLLQAVFPWVTVPSGMTAGSSPLLVFWVAFSKLPLWTLLLPLLCGNSPCPCVVSTVCGCTSPGRCPHRRGRCWVGAGWAVFAADCRSCPVVVREQDWARHLSLCRAAFSLFCCCSELCPWLGAVPAPSFCLKAHCKCTIMHLFFNCCGVTARDLAACVSPWPFSHGR